MRNLQKEQLGPSISMATIVEIIWPLISLGAYSVHV